MNNTTSGNNQDNNNERNKNATETADNGSVPGEVSLGGATSIGSQSGCAGDAFTPRGGNRSAGESNRRT